MFHELTMSFEDKGYSINKDDEGYYTIYEGDRINFVDVFDAKQWLNSVDNCVWLDDSESSASVYEYNIDSRGSVTITSDNRKIAFLQNEDASELIQAIENAENGIFKKDYNPLNLLLSTYDN